MRSRNPFTFSGHFKLEKDHLIRTCNVCRNPFTFSGHFKCSSSCKSLCQDQVAIPSLFQGISSGVLAALQVPVVRSQSLHFFRAFQARKSHARNTYQSRNPFTFSGHFKERLLRGKNSLKGCRNPFTFSGHFKSTYS